MDFRPTERIRVKHDESVQRFDWDVIEADGGPIFRVVK
jgi:hypothetical protein